MIRTNPYSNLSNQQLVHEISRKLFCFDDLSDLREEIMRRIGRMDTIESSNNFLRKELKVFIKELSESEKNKTQFLSNIRNQLNNPIGSIIILSQYLMQKFENYKDESETIGLIHNEAVNLDFALKNLVISGEFEAGETGLELNSFCVKDMINDSQKTFASKISEKNIKLKIKCSASLKIRSDRPKLLLAVQNLISNAVAFSEQGGEISVNVANQNKSNIAITVSDNGIGFKREEAGRIFQRFKQLQNLPDRQHVSSGIGLCVVKKIAELLDGELAYESNPTLGSKFTLTIPKELKNPSELKFDQNGISFETTVHGSKEY